MGNYKIEITNKLLFTVLIQRNIYMEYAIKAVKLLLQEIDCKSMKCTFKEFLRLLRGDWKNNETIQH